MKTQLRQKVNQKLVITPDLRQAIQLMQLSSEDLEQQIIEAVTENPLLNLEKTHEPTKTDIPQRQNDSASSANVLFSNEHNTTHASFKKSEFEIHDVAYNSLQAYLKWQLNFYQLTELENVIALHIIDSINDDGFFTNSVNAIQKNIGTTVKKTQITRILNLIQQFDPAGVGSENLVDYLLFQLHHAPQFHLSEVYTLSEKLIKNELPQLASHQYGKLLNKYHTNKHALHAAINLITSLNLRPNTHYYPNTTPFIIPDVRIHKVNHQWIVELNQSTISNLSLDKKNLQLLHQERKKATVRSYLKEKLYSAKWLIKCLTHREETLLKVSQAIFYHQKAFLDKGSVAIKPLTQRQIAMELDMHESSVSRIIANKYIETPFGIFLLSYFFSSHLKTSDNKDISSKQVINLIQYLITHEHPQKTLSDQKLTELLKRKYSITIARRTVSKYRENLGFLPARFRGKKTD